MIPNQWYAVLESDEVKPGKPAPFKRLSEELVFWRDKQNKIVVMRDLCPHRQSKLSPGKIVDGNIQCHFHGFQYDREGACQLIPANGRTGPKPKVFQCRTYVSQEAFGFIWIWTGELQETYPPVPFFEGLEAFSYATLQRQWNVHYTRVIESLLDVSHLPFVHETTIGRGVGTLVNGPYTTLEDDKMRVWISNQPDAGLPALKPSEVAPPDRPSDLRFNYPNVWQLRIADSFNNVTIAAPIDEANTMIYIRTYVKQPSRLGRLIARMSNLYNARVLREDELIVTTQYPKQGDLDTGYFIPGDRPIALYLQHRRTLMEATDQESGAEQLERSLYTLAEEAR